MRHQPRLRQSPLAIAALVAATGVALPALADTTSTFANFNGDISLNNDASLLPTGVGGTGAIAIDPNNPNLMYVVNRDEPPTAPANPANGGIYPFDLTTKTRLTNSSGNIFITSGAPMTWTSATDPYSAVVGNDGSLYVAMYVSAGVFKIANPLSDAPAVTRILPNYAGGTDDDIVNLARMPANFGLSGYTTNDLVFFDDGNNTDGANAVVALHADGSDGAAPVIVWKRPAETIRPDGTIHGAVDPLSGYAYFISTVPERNTIDGTEYAILNRVKGDGVLQSIGIRLPAGSTLANADDPIAINPVDGSIWLAEVTTGDGRTMLRVDTAYLSPTSDPNTFLTNATAEFTATNFNIGVNGLTFSNDGKTLYVGTPSGTDKIYAFNTLIHTPGDPNGDGVVDADDYAIIDRGVAASLAGFTNGDFNVDGLINSADYLILDTAYSQSLGSAPADLLSQRLSQFGQTYVDQLVAAVPEPTSLAACGLALPLLLRRRHAR